MITHEEAKECISRLFDSYIYGDFIPFPTRSDLDTLSLYINQQEALVVEHEALKKDVARYVELDFFHIAPYRFRKKYANENKLIGETVKEAISRLDNEWLSFIQKLKKVGKEE